MARRRVRIPPPEVTVRVGHARGQTLDASVLGASTDARSRHDDLVSDAEATKVMLEALSDIRSAVYEIRDGLFGDGDDEETEQDDT